MLRQSLASLADNFSAPYIGYYLASLTPSGITQGVLQFSTNALPTLAQVLAGPYIDRFKKYILMLFTSSVIASLIWITISLTRNPTVLTILVTLRAIFVGIAGLSFTAFIGFMFSDIERGRILSKVNATAQLMALIAFVVTASLIIPSVETLRLLFVFSGVLSFIASIFWLRMIYIDRSIAKDNLGREKGLLPALKVVTNNKSFVKFCVIYSCHMMAMALAWPWFPLMQKYVLNMSITEIAILNICGTSSLILFQYFITNYIHKLNVKKTIIISRIGFTTYALSYAIANNPIQIYIANTILGPFTALSNIFIPLYIFRVSTHGMYASYLATLNFTQGMSAALGSIIGGTIADIIASNNNFYALRYAMAVVAILRGITALLHIKIDDR
ncbi:MAG: MFS transporter [Ignisphaera sp.]